MQDLPNQAIVSRGIYPVCNDKNVNCHTALDAVSQDFGVEELRRSYGIRNDTTLPTLDGEGGRIPDGVIDETTSRTTPSPALPLGEGEATSSHTALDAVSQDITSSSITISVTNFSTIQPFNFSTLI